MKFRLGFKLIFTPQTSLFLNYTYWEQSSSNVGAFASDTNGRTLVWINILIFYPKQFSERKKTGGEKSTKNVIEITRTISYSNIL